MAVRWSLFAAAMFLSGMVCALCAIYVVRRRGAVGRTGLAVVLAASAVWGLAYGLELSAVTRSAKEFWGVAKYVGVSALPPAWLVFALQYTGRERRVTRALLAVLTIEPVVVLALMVVPSTSALVRSYPPGSLDPFPVVELGPVFWALAAYSALLVLVATGMLVVTLLRLSAAYGHRTRLLLGAIALVWIANLLTNIGVGEFRRIDPTPVALAVAGLMLILSVFRFGLLDLVPVARTTLVETMSDAVLVLDAYHRVVDLNPAAQQLVGRPTSHVLGHRAEDLLGGPPSPMDFRRARQELALVRNGAERAYEVVLSDLGDREGAIGGHLLVLRDITERKRAERHLEHLAHYDGITGLPNRKLFTDRLGQALNRARRDRVALAVLFFDLDRFKVINDSLGHDAGDQTLVAVARRVRQCLRSEDTLARFGGDEFSILLPEISHSEDAAVVAKKILRAMARPTPVYGRELDVTMSVGIAVWPEDGSDAGSMLNQADAAMYAAKAKGRHRFEFANAQLGRNASTLLELESDLRRALRRQELFLEFQPLVDVRTCGLLGFEALVRWKHPRRGLVPPADFVPLAEDLGVIAEIDDWVVREACRHIRRCDGAIEGRPYVAVNLSPAQLAREDLRGGIDRALRDTGLEPARLCLELSERAVAEDEDAFAAELAGLKALGVSLALDDFGAGRTSLGQLRHLPLTAVKIDQRFVQHLTDDENDLVVVSAIVGLAHALGLTVVAEGVERSEQLRRLRELGCDVGQGYLFARPQPIACFLERPAATFR